MNETEEIEAHFYEVRDTLRDSNGRSYREFKASLKPRFSVLWAQIAFGYLSIACIGIALIFATHASWWFVIPSVILGAFLIGYATASVNLFFHEAVHYNLAPNRRWNDWLANLCIGLPVGAAIQNYRPIHFGHHRNHGTTSDTEISYFDALNMRFLAEALCGVRSLRALAFRKGLAARSGEAAVKPQAGIGRLMLGAGLAFNFLLVGGCVLFKLWPVMVAWLLGVFVVFPFLAALRQVLEHRDEHASAAIDYRLQAHGRVNRLFGDGLFASTLGSAGFNRHLLHHWEPQVSCTRLGELESFIMDTSFSNELGKRRTTYLQIFRRLFSR